MIRRAALSLALLLWPICAWAGFGTPASIAATGSTAGATLTASVTATSGRLLYAAVCENSSSFASGTLSDAVNGSWTRITGVFLNGSASLGGVSIFYVASTGTLSSTTLTYTKGASAQAATLSAFQVSGQDVSPLDSGVTAATTGDSTTPVVLSGAPSVPDELIVGVVCWASGVTSGFVQDSINGAYATPPNGAASSQDAVQGGYIIYTGTSARTYAPAISNHNWGEIIAGFKPFVAPAGGALCTMSITGVGPC